MVSADHAKGNPGVFLALTLAVIIIVALITRDLQTTIAIVSLITSFFIISAQLTMLERLRRPKKSESSSTDSFLPAVTSPAPAPPPPAFTYVPRVPASADANTEPPYPGAIDFTDEVEGDPSGLSHPVGPATSRGVAGAPDAVFSAAPTGDALLGDEAPALGHRDWTTSARDNVAEGNPFDVGRVGAPQAAPPCIDDEASAYLDGDELNTIQARARNDPTRVWAGIYRRKELVNRYVGEALDEAQDSRWWGIHEI